MHRPELNPAMRRRRREFLQVAGLAATSALLPGTATLRAAPAANRRPAAKSCILVYLLGGPPHLDMFDLKPQAPAEIRGPLAPIATSVPGVQISELLPQLAQRADRYALLRAVSHPNSNHTPMIYYTLTGHPVERPNQDNDVRPPQRGDFPHLGAVMAKLLPGDSGLPGYVAMPEVAVRTNGQNQRGWTLLRGGGGGFLGPRYDPLGVNGEPGTPGAIPALTLPEDVPPQRLARRATLLRLLEGHGPVSPAMAEMTLLRDRAVRLTGAAGGDALQAFSLAGEPDNLQQRYGKHRFGRALLAARRLVEAGVPMVAIHFNNMSQCDGWDTHTKNFDAMRELLPMVDAGLATLLDDLQDRGLLDRTVVACFGEFGRTPKINGNAGRDHWGNCASALLAGGGIRGGVVHGASDRSGAYPVAGKVDPVDVHATIFHCLGLDPHQTIVDLAGRPWPISQGRVIGPLV